VSPIKEELYSRFPAWLVRDAFPIRLFNLDIVLFIDYFVSWFINRLSSGPLLFVIRVGISESEKQNCVVLSIIWCTQKMSFKYTINLFLGLLFSIFQYPYWRIQRLPTKKINKRVIYRDRDLPYQDLPLTTKNQTFLVLVQLRLF